MKDSSKGFKDFDKLLERLAKTKISAGVFADAGTNSKSGTSVVDYAYYNEYGTDKIPARPFMSLTADAQKDNWANLMAASFDKIVATQGGSVDRELGRIGERMINDIKETISSNIAPVNAPSTIKRKKSSRTLIDTGYLRSSISSKIIKEQR